MTLMQSGKELLNPFNTNDLLMAFTADLPNAELKHMRTADITLIDKRSSIYRVTYATAESLSNCLHAWLFIVSKSEPRVLVSDPYLRYVKQTMPTEGTTDTHEACLVDSCRLNKVY